MAHHGVPPNTDMDYVLRQLIAACRWRWGMRVEGYEDYDGMQDWDGDHPEAEECLYEAEIALNQIKCGQPSEE